LKYLRHQFGLLRQVWPDVLGGRLYAEKPSASASASVDCWTLPPNAATLSRQVLDGAGGPFPLSHKGPEPVQQRTFHKICG